MMCAFAAAFGALLALSPQGGAKMENEAISFDSRLVHDIAELPFETADRRSPWVVVKITPGPNSGAGTVAGVVIDGATGKAIPQHDSGQNVTVDRGEWTIVRVLGPYGGPLQGSYQKAENVQTHKRSVDPENVFSPLVRGGVVVCQVHAGASANPLSGPLYVVKPEWEGQVEAAYEAVYKAKPGQETLVAAGENLMLGPISYRAWLREDASSRIKASPAQWNSVEGIQRSGLVYVLLTTSSTERSRASSARLTELIDGGEPKVLHDVALGIFSAVVFQSKIDDGSLLQTLIQHIERASSSSTDPYVRRLPAIRR